MFSALHECGHISLWRTSSAMPAVQEQLTCGTCGKAVRVVQVFGPWRVLCLNCRRVNGHATLRQTVVRTATRHVQEWSTHRVRIWQYGDQRSVTVITTKEVGVQPHLISDAPF